MLALKQAVHYCKHFRSISSFRGDNTAEVNDIFIFELSILLKLTALKRAEIGFERRETGSRDLT